MPDAETDTLRQVPEASTELTDLSTARRGEQTNKSVSRISQTCLKFMGESGVGGLRSERRLRFYRICNFLILRHGLLESKVKSVAYELVTNRDLLDKRYRLQEKAEVNQREVMPRIDMKAQALGCLGCLDKRLPLLFPGQWDRPTHRALCRVRFGQYPSWRHTRPSRHRDRQKWRYGYPRP